MSAYCRYETKRNLFEYEQEYIMYMLRFIDVHSLGAYTDKELKRFQESPMDKYSVRIVNIFYNRATGISFCLLEVPSREAVEKHHEKYELNVLG